MYDDYDSHFFINHNLNVVQSDDCIITVNGIRLKNISYFHQMVNKSTSPITLIIRRLRRHLNIPNTYIINYDSGEEIGLSLRMSPSIRIEVYVAAIYIAHHNEGVKFGDILMEFINIITGESLDFGDTITAFTKNFNELKAKHPTSIHRFFFERKERRRILFYNTFNQKTLGLAFIRNKHVMNGCVYVTKCNREIEYANEEAGVYAKIEEGDLLLKVNDNSITSLSQAATLMKESASPIKFKL